MIGLLLKWKQIISVGAIVLLLSWFGWTIYQNQSLLEDRADLQSKLAASEQVISALAKAKVVSDEILIENKKEQESVQKDLTYTQTELRKLRNEIQDKCLDAVVPDPLLNRL
jgi:hypothetical protein